ncbi:hypothetical protein CKG00_14555 (plasmid) [Morganella morganii]|uniref:Uncharacterized protein n=1 Tax=Morganella morganii TaxID=582 RepID=A0A433ZQL4_MORMO|nr:hypothetical protein [Morganella morganii]RUT64414.1 hypothetical protein CKG00_14555 [Morganella morganii]
MDTLQQVLYRSLQAVQTEYTPALTQSGQLLNFAPSQIPQLQDDLQCLYGKPLLRFPDPQDISRKLTVLQRLRRQIPAQNGILWQHFRKNAAPADDALLTDEVLRWLFTHISATGHT